MIALVSVFASAVLAAPVPAAKFNAAQPTGFRLNGTGPYVHEYGRIIAHNATTRSDTIELEFGGITRTAEVYVPEQVVAAPMPLVFNYHGFGGTGASQMASSRMNEVADTYEFIVIYPDGVENSHNGGACCGPANDPESPVDDVGLARALINEVDQLSPVIRTQVYSTGMSNGGFMSIRLGCEASDVFAAVSSVTGVLGNEFAEADQFVCERQGRSVPYIHLHGTADEVVPFDGRAELGFKSVADTMATFAGINDCRPDGSPPTFENGFASCRSLECSDSATANTTLCTVELGGHTWFGQDSCVGADCDIDASEIVWEFFTRYRLP